MTRRIHVVMEEDLLERIDNAKGVGQSRGDLIRRTLEEALGSQRVGGKSSTEDARVDHRNMPASPRAPVRNADALDRQAKLNAARKS